VAYEIPGFSWTPLAGEDLSSSQFCGVDIDSAGEAVLPSAGGRCVGFVRNKPAAGIAVTVVTTGIVMAKVGATGVVAGNNVSVDSDGTVIQSASGDISVGVALATNAPDEITSVLLLIGQSAVTGS
jgi:hypothetical protein